MVRKKKHQKRENDRIAGIEQPGTKRRLQNWLLEQQEQSFEGKCTSIGGRATCFFQPKQIFKNKAKAQHINRENVNTECKRAAPFMISGIRVFRKGSSERHQAVMVGVGAKSPLNCSLICLSPIYRWRWRGRGTLKRNVCCLRWWRLAGHAVINGTLLPSCFRYFFGVLICMRTVL